MTGTKPAVWRIIGLFLIHAIAGGAIYTRIADIQLALGLSEAQLGLALMGQPIGALAMFLFSSRIIESQGPLRITLVLLPVMSLSFFAAAVAPNGMALFATMLVSGLTYSLINVAMNVEADRVETMVGHRIMNRCHGIWSLGFLGTSLLGTLTRGFDIGQGIHMGVLVPLTLIAVALIIYPMASAPPRAHAGTARAARLALPTLATLALVGYGLGAGVLEGATRTWSIIYMRDSFVAPAWIETLTLPALLGAMAIGRLLTDRFVDRHGPMLVAGILGVISIGGLALIVVAPMLELALAGFAIMGLGLCASFPLMLSAAARIGDRPASENVAATTLLIQLSGLISPPLLGWVAQSFGIRTTFALLLPLLALSLAMVRTLAPKPKG